MKLTNKSKFTNPLLTGILMMMWQCVPSKAATETRMTIAPSGAMVTDSQSQLTWARCVEGMQWNGKTCIGEPMVLSRGGAMALALERGKADGLPWRVPQMNEIRGLMHGQVRANAGGAALDAKIFPGLPVGWTWSSTSSVNAAPVNQYSYDNIARGRTTDNANLSAMRTGWAVHSGTGDADGNVNKRALMFVWLVHSNSP